MKNKRGALAIGDPVRRNRRARAQQFLNDHEACKWSTIMTAIALRKGQAEKPRLAKAARKVAIEPGPGAGPLVDRTCGDRRLRNGANGGPDRVVFGGERSESEGVEQRSISMSRRCWIARRQHRAWRNPPSASNIY
jgi:hypothetical protein